MWSPKESHSSKRKAAKTISEASIRSICRKTKKLVLNVMFFKVRIDAGTSSKNWLAELQPQLKTINQSGSESMGAAAGEGELKQERETMHLKWKTRDRLQAILGPL